MSVHNRLSDAYDAYRPDYPTQLFVFLQNRLQLGRHARVADVACGMGRSTLPWCAITESITGIEADAPLVLKARRRAAELGYDISWVQALAESTGLFSASQDLVTVAQAFHWFGPQTLDEFARILRPGGALAIYWNVPAEQEAPYFKELTRLIRAYNPAYPESYHHYKDTEARLEAHPAFPTVETHTFRHTVRFSVDQYLGYQASRSLVGGAIVEQAWDAFRSELSASLYRHFPDGTVVEAYDTELYLGLKEGSPR